MSLVRLMLVPTLIVGSLGVGVIAEDQLSGETAIEVRQELMRSNGAVMRTAADAKGADAVAVGETLVANFARLPNLFPDDSQEGDTRALPVIWEDEEGFQAEIAAAQEAAQHVLDAANAQDMTAYGEALKAMGARCGSCHTQYRAE